MRTSLDPELLPAGKRSNLQRLLRMRGEGDLTSYLLGERSELRALIEAIAAGGNDSERERAAVEYLLLLASARFAARRETPEPHALAQIRSRYARIYTRDNTEHSRILRELHASLTSGSAVAIITALKLLGLHHRREGSFQLARASLSVAVEIGGQLQDPIEQLNSLFWLGVVERYLGNLDTAQAIHHQQLEKARACGHRGQAILAQENLGLVALRRGRIAEARNLAIRALTEAATLEDRELEGYCYHALMVIEIESGRPGEAAACGWEAYRRYESTDQQMRALQDCGVILYKSGMLEAARAAFELVRAGHSDTASRIRAATGLADVAAAESNRTQFMRVVQELLAEDAIRSLPFELQSAYRTIGRGYARFGDLGIARQYLEAALKVALDRGYQSEVPAIKELLADLGAGLSAFEQTPAPETERARLVEVSRSVLAERARAIA